MKVFISWSGELSHRVALLLRDWLPDVIHLVEPYVSSEDIDKGSRWFTSIASELEDSKFGIVCLTRDNLTAPWILFESGAISKSIAQSRITPLLIDLNPSELKGPLTQFQATSFCKDDIWKLLESINRSLGQQRLKDALVEKSFTKWWPDLEQGFNEALNRVVISPAQKRGPREIAFSIPDLRKAADQLSKEISQIDLEQVGAIACSVENFLLGYFISTDLNRELVCVQYAKEWVNDFEMSPFLCGEMEQGGTVAIVCRVVHSGELQRIIIGILEGSGIKVSHCFCVYEIGSTLRMYLAEKHISLHSCYKLTKTT